MAKNNSRNKNNLFRTVTKSKLYNRLTNTDKVFSVRTSRSTKAGVKVVEKGEKKGMELHLAVPSTTINGEERIVYMVLSGRQARAIFETLDRHYINSFKAF